MTREQGYYRTHQPWSVPLDEFGLRVLPNSVNWTTTTLSQRPNSLTSLTNASMELLNAWKLLLNLSLTLPTLCEKHVNNKLRLTVLIATVTPALACSLATYPLTKCQLDQLAIAQRKILRRVVAWRSDENGTLKNLGRKMELRLSTALSLCPIGDCSLLVFDRKESC